MDNLVFKQVYEKDKLQVFNLIKSVLENLERKEFFIPFTEEELTHLFDDNYGPMYGCYYNDKLVGISQLYISTDVIEEYYDIFNIKKSKRICELGGFLVLKEYWNKGIMTKLSKLAYDSAHKLNFDYIFATAHPDNSSSNHILQKLGLELFDTITTSSGYLRNVYLKKLK